VLLEEAEEVEARHPSVGVVGEEEEGEVHPMMVEGEVHLMMVAGEVAVARATKGEVAEEARWTQEGEGPLVATAAAAVERSTSEVEARRVGVEAPPGRVSAPGAACLLAVMAVAQGRPRPVPLGGVVVEEPLQARLSVAAAEQLPC
jgi:hypothetical protein